MMNRIWTFGLMVVLTGVLAGCKEETTATGSIEVTPTTNPATAGYPLTTCVVSGEPLGSMGDPVIYSHEGREVRFCCTNCEAEFKKEPSKFIGLLDNAMKSGSHPATQPAQHAH